MTTNDPIRVLMDEHEVIASARDAVLALDATWTTDPVKYREKVRELARFFRQYSDNFHHRKEEEILFRELVNHPSFMQPDIISELEEHHAMFRDITMKIEGAVEREEWEAAQKLLSSYMDDLLNHIAVENDELFVMAASLFSPEELERMYFRFADTDAELGIDLKRQLAEIPGMAGK